MIENMLTQEEFEISEEVVQQIKNNPELLSIHLDMFKSLESNPLLKWTVETLENYDNLCLTLSIQERKQEFAVNAYYHLLKLASNYEDVHVNWPSALEIAQAEIVELFTLYNSKEIIYSETNLN